MANTVRPFVGSPTQKQVCVASGTGRPPAGHRTLTVCVHSLPCECVPDFFLPLFFLSHLERASTFRRVRMEPN